MQKKICTAFYNRFTLPVIMTMYNIIVIFQKSLPNDPARKYQMNGAGSKESKSNTLNSFFYCTAYVRFSWFSITRMYYERTELTTPKQLFLRFLFLTVLSIKILNILFFIYSLYIIHHKCVFRCCYHYKTKSCSSQCFVFSDTVLLFLDIWK